MVERSAGRVSMAERSAGRGGNMAERPSAERGRAECFNHVELMASLRASLEGGWDESKTTEDGSIVGLINRWFCSRIRQAQYQINGIINTLAVY